MSKNDKKHKGKFKFQKNDREESSKADLSKDFDSTGSHIAESQSAETQTAETQTVETQSAESKTVETQTAESKPAESKTVKSKSKARIHEEEDAAEPVRKNFSRPKPAAGSIIDMEHLRKTGIFAGIILVLLGLLIGFSILANRFWNRGLKQKLSTVLEKNGISCIVGDALEVESVMGLNCAVFSLSADDGSGENLYGIILRETTIYGPLAAVFLYDGASDSCSFVDYADVEGCTLEQIVQSTRNSQIQYWENRIPVIIKNVCPAFSLEAKNEKE